MTSTPGILGSALKWAALTPSDGTTLTPIPRALWIDAQGDVVVEGSDGNEETFSSVAAGTVLDIRPTKLKAATTATVIALY